MIKLKWFKKCRIDSMEDYQAKNVRNFFWSQMSLLHKVLDPPSYTRDLQRAKFWNSILGHNFWMEGPMDLNSTPLSYIFNALFRDTPLAHLLLRHMCHICHICHVTCVTYVTCRTSTLFFSDSASFCNTLFKFAPVLVSGRHCLRWEAAAVKNLKIFSSSLWN